MNTKQMELLVDLSQTLNFRKTADNMYISQPALTHQIKNIEEELGFKLFERSTQGVSLTPAGKLFCQNTQPLLASIKQNISACKNCSHDYADSMIIAINPQRHTHQLAEILRRFDAENKTVMPQVKKILGMEKLNAFLRGEIDVTVFVADSLKPSMNIVSEKLYESRLYCVVNRCSPLACKELITAADLEGEILFTSTGGPRFLINAQNDLKKKTRFRERFSQSFEETTLWVRAVESAAIVPGYCYFNDPELVWIPYDWHERASFNLACRPGDKRECIRRFVEITKEVFQSDIENGLVL